MGRLVASFRRESRQMREQTDTRYKKLYLKSVDISHQGYFTDKQSERLYNYKHITNHKKFELISQKFTLL